MDFESESGTNSPCQYASSDGLIEKDFEDKSSIKVISDRVHRPQVPLEGAELSGNTAKLVKKKTKDLLDVTPCSLVDSFHLLGQNCYFRLQDIYI
jgi:hypothetical protein